MHVFGAVFAEVAVDPDLRETRVRRIAEAYGAGRIVNPSARTQGTGGMIGGIGMALMEHSVIDPRNGRVPNPAWRNTLCRCIRTHHARWK